MKSILSLILLGTSLILFAQKDVPLYPDGMPNTFNIDNTETFETRSDGTRFYFDTNYPTLTAYQPAHPNGKAIVVCPGGGYRGTSQDKEGHMVAERFIRDSITVFVLKYRIPQDTAFPDKSLAPLQDAQQAIRLVRTQAKTWQIDPHQIGIMGFSAGGHLAAMAATLFREHADPDCKDTTSVRPDFAILIYPVISFEDPLAHVGSRTNLVGEHPDAATVLHFSADKQVTEATPPTFLVHAGDDKSVPVGNSIAFYEACHAHGVPVEMHLYPAGGHGFGMYNKTTLDFWPDRVINWLRTL